MGENPHQIYISTLNDFCNYFFLNLYVIAKKQEKEF